MCAMLVKNMSLTLLHSAPISVHCPVKHVANAMTTAVAWQLIVQNAASNAGHNRC